MPIRVVGASVSDGEFRASSAHHGIRTAIELLVRIGDVPPKMPLAQGCQQNKVNLGTASGP
jgi:hypothetical protein